MYEIQWVPNITTIWSQPKNSPCEGCTNNPMVNKFASGFCNCTLGDRAWY